MNIPEFDLVLYEDFEVAKPKYKGFQNWVFNAPADTATKGYKMKIREIFYNILNKLYDDYINTQINPESYKIRKSIEYLQNNFTNQEINFAEVASLSENNRIHSHQIQS